MCVLLLRVYYYDYLNLKKKKNYITIISTITNILFKRYDIETSRVIILLYHTDLILPKR